MSAAPARWRGATSGLLTAALALAAHSSGGGELPTGVAAAQLILIAAIVGGVAAAAPDADRPRTLLGLLGAGQLTGHAVLAAQGHSHVAALAPAWVMLAGHVVAVAIGAALIGTGGHLCRVMTHVLRLARRRAGPQARPPRRFPVPSADHPMQSALQLTWSISHRGPPVSLAR